MKKVLVIGVALAALGLVSHAQTPGELAASPAVQETQDIQADITNSPEEVLTQSISSSLAAKGKSLGVINGDGSIYVIGAASTVIPSNMPGFIGSRNNAYSIAELTAKMNLLRMAGEFISSGRGFQLLEDIIEGEDPDAKEKASILEKAERVVDRSLDRALAELGVSEDEIRAMNEAKKKAVYQQNLNQVTRSLVAGMVKGCAVVRIAEGELGRDDYQVAVCLKYSPEFQSFASIIRKGGTGSVPTASSVDSRNKILTLPESELVKRMGVWVTYDTQGQMVVYGFGQQEVHENGSRASAALSRAYSQARLQAINNIKNFVAEDLVATETIENVEKLREYADGSNAYFSRDKWEQAVLARKSTLNLATEQVLQWKTVHPLSNTTLVGFIVAWTSGHSRQAHQLDGQITTPSRQQTQSGEITITGDDDNL